MPLQSNGIFVLIETLMLILCWNFRPLGEGNKSGILTLRNAHFCCHRKGNRSNYSQNRQTDNKSLHSASRQKLEDAAFDKREGHNRN